VDNALDLLKVLNAQSNQNISLDSLVLYSIALSAQEHQFMRLKWNNTNMQLFDNVNLNLHQNSSFRVHKQAQLLKLSGWEQRLKNSKETKEIK